MPDVTVIDYLATAMISPVHSTEPEAIRTAVRQQTIATVEDLKRPCDQDLEAARQIVPLIAVGAARGSMEVGGSLGAMAGPVMEGILAGTAEIGGDRGQAARSTAEALIREAGRQEGELVLTATGVVSGVTETGGPEAAVVIEAALRGLLDGATQIGPEADKAVRQALRDTDEAYQQSSARTRTDQAKAAR